MNPALDTPGLILVTLLIKLGFIASLASIVARFGRFRRLLFVEQRGPRQKLVFAAFLGVPFMLGTLARLLAGYKGADLNLEITVVAGLLGGTIVGLSFGSLSAKISRSRSTSSDLSVALSSSISASNTGLPLLRRRSIPRARFSRNIL